MLDTMSWTLKKLINIIIAADLNYWFFFGQGKFGAFHCNNCFVLDHIYNTTIHLWWWFCRKSFCSLSRGSNKLQQATKRVAFLSGASKWGMNFVAIRLICKSLAKIRGTEFYERPDNTISLSIVCPFIIVHNRANIF